MNPTTTTAWAALADQYKDFGLAPTSGLVLAGDPQRSERI